MTQQNSNGTLRIFSAMACAAPPYRQPSMTSPMGNALTPPRDLWPTAYHRALEGGNFLCLETKLQHGSQEK